MMVTRVRINPAMMKWARAYAGFINGYEEKLPKDIKSKYKSWENGEKLPTWNQLRNVSKKYKVPTAFFFMNKTPEYNNLPKLINYRKLDTTLIFENNSPSLISNIRQSETRSDIYLELLKSPKDDSKPANYTIIQGGFTGGAGTTNVIYNGNGVPEETTLEM